MYNYYIVYTLYISHLCMHTYLIQNSTLNPAILILPSPFQQYYIYLCTSANSLSQPSSCTTIILYIYITSLYFCTNKFHQVNNLALSYYTTSLSLSLCKAPHTLLASIFDLTRHSPSAKCSRLVQCTTPFKGFLLQTR